MIEQQATVNRRYRVDRLVGMGGMAIVYLGHDLLLSRDVAIKALQPRYAADHAFRLRFEREAQAAAAFSHPNIIDIYDVGEEDGNPYIVMEFVHGQTLQEIIEAEAPFHPDDVAALLHQLGAALDYAHERGYVHRDVKPRNVLVDAHGRARVVDFGIAKSLADADLTAVGEGLGTVHYLSPEQASGLMATPASDIYAAGVIAFEMLTGALPFTAESPLGIAMRHVHDAPPRPSHLLPTVPPAVDAIVTRALDKDPTRRFPSAGDFSITFANWRDYHFGHSPPARPEATTVALPAIVAPRPERVRSGQRFDQTPPATSEVIAAEFVPAIARSRTNSLIRTAPRGEAGCAPWVVGAVILLGLLGLVLVGLRLSPRVPGFSGGAPAPTAVVAPTSGPRSEAAATNVSAGRSDSAPPGANQFQVEIPDLTGLSEVQARDRLAADGVLVVIGEPVFSDHVPVGAIAEHDPPPGSLLTPGESLYVKLSRGSAQVNLADLALPGRDPSDATSILQGRGLAVDRAEVPSSDVPAGLVAGSDPAGMVEAGDTVVLLISVGGLVQIPTDLQGQSLPRVVSDLEQLGLRVDQRVPVGRQELAREGIDVAVAGIEDGDVVRLQGRGIRPGAWVEPGTAVIVVYYDQTLDRG